MDASLCLAVGISGSVAAWLGWQLRGMRHYTERRVIEEIFSRKARLAESEREAAVRTLGQAKAESGANLERFEAATADASRVQAELASARNALASTRQGLAQTEARLASAVAEG